MRRVLHHIREEYSSSQASTPPLDAFSIANFVLLGQPHKHSTTKSENKVAFKDIDPDDPDAFARTWKPVLMEAIQDVFDELDTVYDNISKNARDHIHSECVSLCILLCAKASKRDHLDTGHVADCGSILKGSRTSQKIYRDSRGGCPNVCPFLIVHTNRLANTDLEAEAWQNHYQLQASPLSSSLTPPYTH